ncbi:hypothetical protein CcaverHIS002_0300210 [Cutaneotrichosporon cavernicola]|uniref:DUF1479-domain-containing protein n=1 Tax=Cutaneotrichosporon cavernicola TaxID=279322 RepID=A0AA48I2J7_9TREE|nr:uncharacterized protein CcaverHIS019_0300210 [Cutaneotrichosporon cavernicola]BEI82153.1 hypothetical protein CcaverHIS002_0300210 [Cutaneotrichosporon cavernicola]BEI89951.1 hypothetical protein CcaverHIS019_0300210 [Cutaneotrichosporon cavernicola]BEI97724.1 hypothetical protein CcaverHIS631_0300230 [Cutaneotrichosporon cavernicola]BEJ05501.1 hypothetical protein CcaverHIS641_0300230 [Cutaneotrichosporon cavernicola]
MSRTVKLATLAHLPIRRGMASSARGLATEIQREMVAPQPPMMRKQRAEGDIGSVFASLSGEAEQPLPARFADLKRLIAGDEANRARLVSSFRSLTSRLVVAAAEIERLGTNAVPTVSYESLLARDPATVAAIKRSGTAVVQGVVPRTEAEAWLQQVEAYVAANPQVRGFPADDKQVFEIYWSKPQLAARGHQRSLAAQRALLSLFSLPQSAQVSLTPISYADRLRVRHPGDSKFALGPHMDGGSVERWEDPAYRAVYARILEGRWENYDAYELEARARANQNLYDGAGACGVFRAFQGWTSLSDTGPGEGTLRVYPLIREMTAYTLLRPFFREKAPRAAVSREHYLAPENWELDIDSTVFPQAPLGRSQEFNDASHPHLELDRTMVSIPRVQPGDQAWWHADVIHAVESVHRGAGPSAVMYIPSVPLTRLNAEYIRDQRACFEARCPPPDFPGGEGESTFSGTGTPADIEGVDARRALGFEAFPVTPDMRAGEQAVRRAANDVLGF